MSFGNCSNCGGRLEDDGVQIGKTLVSWGSCEGCNSINGYEERDPSENEEITFPKFEKSSPPKHLEEDLKKFLEYV